MNEIQTHAPTEVELQYPSKWMLELDLLLLQQSMDAFEQIIEDADNPDWTADAQAELLSCEIELEKLRGFKQTEEYQRLPD